MTDEAENTDEVLVARALDGDRSAFDRLVERHFGGVYAAGLARLRDPEAAEDLAQEVFLRGFVQLGELRDRRYFGTWMGRVARNMAVDWVRRRQTRSRLVPLLQSDPERAIARVADPRKGVRERMDEDRENDALREALDSLSDEERELVLLQYMEGLSRREIADRLGIHPSTVGRRIDGVLSRLRGLVEPALRRDLKAWRPSMRAVGSTLGAIAFVSALSGTARAELLAAAAWREGAAAVANAAASAAASVSSSAAVSGTGTASCSASGFLASLSAYLTTGGLLTMGTAKIVTLTVAAVVVAGGLYRITRPAGNPPAAPSVLVQGAARRNLPLPPPLPPLPAGYSLQVSPSKDPNMHQGATVRRNQFGFKGLDLGNALLSAWPSFSPARIQVPADVRDNAVDVHLSGPATVSPTQFQEVLRTEIQRAMGLRMRVERQLRDVWIATAPRGVAAAFKSPASPNGGGMTAGLSKVTVRNQPIRTLLDQLESSTRMPVIDETGIAGRYDYEWTGNTEKAATEVFGLSLAKDRREVDVLVIENDPTATQDGARP